MLLIKSIRPRRLMFWKVMILMLIIALLPGSTIQAVAVQASTSDAEAKLIMHINSDSYTVCGRKGSIDVRPFIEQGHVYVPLRVIVGQISTKLNWDGKNQKANFSYTYAGKSTTIALQPGHKEVLCGGSTKLLTAPPRIVEGRIMVPLEFVELVLGFKAATDGSSITITTGTSERVEALLQQMSLEEKVGQVMLGCFNGPELSQELAQRLTDIHLGGVILYSITGNIENVGQVANLVEDIQQHAVKSGGIPLFVGIDQEGGRVCRITEGVTVFPGNMALGATGNTELARQSASVMAKELRIMGINMNFAPVVDVNNNPNNPVIGVRSFGSSPEDVARLGTAMVDAYQEQGVLASAKHFPGHGDTDIDSHVALPIIPHDIKRLQSVELPPFKAMVEVGVPAVMTAHVLAPAITQSDELPATLSPEALKYLRQDMGFDGLIVSDSLGMGAITQKWGLEEAALQCFLAGADILLFGADEMNGPRTQEQVYQTLLKAAQSGQISSERLDQSVRRILNAKLKYGILDDPLPRQDKMDELAAPENLAVAEQVARESITLVRDIKHVLPFSGRQTVPIIWPQEVEETLAPLLEKCPCLKPYLVPLEPTETELQQLTAEFRDYPTLVVGTYNLYRNTEWAKLVQSLGQERVLALAMGSPYDLMQIPQVSGYVAAYSDKPVTVRALGKLLRGDLSPQGHLPVELP